MATLTFDLVFSAAYADCGAGGITCTGAGGMTAYVEDFLDAGDTLRMRIFRSTNHGATWAEAAQYISPATPWFYQMQSPSGGRVLVGPEGPWFLGRPTGLDDVPFPRSTDHGLTWSPTGGPAHTLFAYDGNDFWLTDDFLVLSSTEVLAHGQYIVGGITYQLLRSLDGGATFGSPLTVHATLDRAVAHAAPGGDVVLLAGDRGGLPSAVFRSTDRGQTFSVIALPNPDNARVEAMASLGGGVVLAGSYDHVWRSADAGLTWTDVTASLPAYAGKVQYMVSPGPGAAVVMAFSQNYWAFTTDGGLTWAAATVTPPTDGATGTVSTYYMGVADTGHVLATTNTSTHFRIWRGTWTGVTGYAGPCAQAVIRPPLKPPPREPCPPPFTPVPCVQLCPPDPPEDLLARLRRVILTPPMPRDLPAEARAMSIPRMPSAVTLPPLTPALARPRYPADPTPAMARALRAARARRRMPRAGEFACAAPLGAFQLGLNCLGLPVSVPGEVGPPPLFDPETNEPLIPPGVTFTNVLCDQRCPPEPALATVVAAAHRHRRAYASRRH